MWILYAQRPRYQITMTPDLLNQPNQLFVSKHQWQYRPVRRYNCTQIWSACSQNVTSTCAFALFKDVWFVDMCVLYILYYILTYIFLVIFVMSWLLFSGCKRHLEFAVTSCTIGGLRNMDAPKMATFPRRWTAEMWSKGRWSRFARTRHWWEEKTEKKGKSIPSTELTCPKFGKWKLIVLTTFDGKYVMLVPGG